jgi:hypothetical protein
MSAANRVTCRPLVFARSLLRRSSTPHPVDMHPRNARVVLRAQDVTDIEQSFLHAVRAEPWLPQLSSLRERASFIVHHHPNTFLKLRQVNRSVICARCFVPALQTFSQQLSVDSREATSNIFGLRVNILALQYPAIELENFRSQHRLLRCHSSGRVLRRVVPEHCHRQTEIPVFFIQ